MAYLKKQNPKVESRVARTLKAHRELEYYRNLYLNEEDTKKRAVRKRDFRLARNRWLDVCEGK